MNIDKRTLIFMFPKNTQNLWKSSTTERPKNLLLHKKRREISSLSMFMDLELCGWLCVCVALLIQKGKGNSNVPSIHIQHDRSHKCSWFFLPLCECGRYEATYTHSHSKNTTISCDCMWSWKQQLFFIYSLVFSSLFSCFLDFANNASTSLCSFLLSFGRLARAVCNFFFSFC